MTSAPEITATNGIEDQMPITLCQLKSRAFPRIPPRNQAIARTLLHVHRLGSHRYIPLRARQKKIKLAAPVIDLPTCRAGPSRANQRCQSVTTRKNRLKRVE